MMFSTNDFDAALVFAREHRATGSAPEDIGSAIVFYLEDPDGNMVCVIWRKPC